MLFYYDLEVFPNYFSGIFLSEDGKDRFVFEKYNDGEVDLVKPLVQFVTSLPDLTLVGYNSLHYDDILLKALIEKPEMTNKQIYAVSGAIIKAEKISDLPRGLKDVALSVSPWFSIDILKLLQVNNNRPSLKHCSIHLEHYRLQDLPLPFNKPVVSQMFPMIIDYNGNDVEITRKLYQLPKINSAISLRLALGKEYNVDLRSAGDSKISNVIFDDAYGTPQVKETRRTLITGSELIPPTLVFHTEEMQNVLNKVRGITITETETYKHVLKTEDSVFDLSAYNDIEDAYSALEEQSKQSSKQAWLILPFNGVNYAIGKGGLHSEDSPRQVIPETGYILRDADVGSYYPSMIIRYELVPEHLDKQRFLKVYIGLVDSRLEAKRTKDKVKADGLKLAVNGAFGKLNFPYFWLYDPLAFYRVTLFGQLFLLDLIEKLYLAGIDCISANTDGIVCYFPKEKEADYYAVCEEWMNRIGMTLEYTDYSKFVQLNVNSYLSVATAKTVYDTDGTRKTYQVNEIKTKKDFEDNKDLDKQTFVKGYMAPVLALALQEYFINGVDPETFIKGHENIHNFFYTQRAGDKFDLYYEEKGNSEKLQKTNRYYVSKTGGILLKRDKTVTTSVVGKTTSRKTTAILRGKYVTILNDIREDRPEIDYDFYIEKVRSIINDIEPKQNKELSIFDLI